MKKADQETNEAANSSSVKPLAESEIGHRVLLVSLNGGGHLPPFPEIQESEMPRRVLMYWPVSNENADQVEYIVGVYQGITRRVFEVNRSADGRALHKKVRVGTRKDGHPNWKQAFQGERSLEMELLWANRQIVNSSGDILTKFPRRVGHRLIGEHSKGGLDQTNDIETAEQAGPFSGDKLYQQRARTALPILVRQAKAQKTIYYEDLAQELGMANPRNLNFVLASIGQSIVQLQKKRDEEIPPIQCLVVNQADGLPGDGVGFFIEKEKYKAMSKRQRRIVLNAQLQRIFAFPNWDAVLKAFSMKPGTWDFSKLVRKAVTYGRGGGESEHHKNLKHHVASHPDIVGLPKTIAHGVTEYSLPSGDELDVLFRYGDEWVGVEVKSQISGDDDLIRGLFQCVKYSAVLEALLLSTESPPNFSTVLVVTKPLPAELLPLRNTLGVEVICTDAPTAAT